MQYGDTFRALISTEGKKGESQLSEPSLGLLLLTNPGMPTKLERDSTIVEKNMIGVQWQEPSNKGGAT